MKPLKTILALIVFSIAFTSLSSCLVLHRTNNSDNGNHKGWYKNSNNPHHPNSTNPGKGNSNGNKHGKK